MQIDYLALVVICVSTITFYRAGNQERSWAVLWASLSIAISFAVLYFTPLRLIGVLAGQVLLFVGITAWRVFGKK